MKVCYIISDIDKAVYFEQTALALQARHADVFFVLINCRNSELLHFLEERKFEVFSFECPKLSRSFSTILQVRRLLKKKRPSVVHCHLATANWVGLWASWLAGIPHRLFTRHSGKPLVLSRKERLADSIQNKLATTIISISRNIDDLLHEQGVPAEKRTLIHHGFDLERFAHPDERAVSDMRERYQVHGKSPVIGVIARWMEWKGIHYIIPAFRELLSTYPDALICFFGATENADYYPELSKQIAELPQESVRIVGFENNVFDLFHLFDVYVHTPVNEQCEAFGQTYIEALAAGVPSVFTLSGVGREFIRNEENALVVPYRSSTEITEAIKRILEQPELKEKLISNGRSSVQQYGFAAYADQLMALYQRLTS